LRVLYARISDGAACSVAGNVTAPGEPEKTTVDDLSIIVDLDKSTVVSEKIWDRPIPFIAIDANEVKFGADINYGSSSVSLYGTIDRITGKTDIGTDRTFRLKNGNAVMIESCGTSQPGTDKRLAGSNPNDC
jgi:hypothetical protein